MYLQFSCVSLLYIFMLHICVSIVILCISCVFVYVCCVIVCIFVYLGAYSMLSSCVFYVQCARAMCYIFAYAYCVLVRVWCQLLVQTLCNKKTKLIRLIEHVTSQMTPCCTHCRLAREKFIVARPNQLFYKYTRLKH